MKAVTQGSESSVWLPECFSIESKGSLKGHEFCSNWRVIPGVVTLVTAIIGIALCLLWNQPFMCIAFAPGGVAAVCLIYIGWNYGNLKTFSENNTEMAATAKKSAETAEEYRKELLKLQQNTEALEEDIRTLKDENEKLVATLKKFEGVKEALGKIEESFGTDLNSFLEYLRLLREQIQKLETSTDKNDEVFVGALGRLDGCCQRFSDLLNKKRVKELTQTMTRLEQLVGAKEVQQARLDEAISQLEPQVKYFEELLGSLKLEVTKLSGIGNSLGDSAALVVSFANGLEEQQTSAPPEQVKQAQQYIKQVLNAKQEIYAH